MKRYKVTLTDKERQELQAYDCIMGKAELHIKLTHARILFEGRRLLRRPRLGSTNASSRRVKIGVATVERVQPASSSRRREAWRRP